MSVALSALSPEGTELVALAEELAGELASRAAAHDRDGSFPFESVELLAEAGVYSAPIPVELGGRGVASLHDVVVAASRLARGDASVAIGVNMHFAALMNMVRRWHAGSSGLGPALEAIARGGTRLAAAVSEPGQDLTRPGTVATRHKTGWRIDGRKLFCTGSPSATILYTSVRFADERGIERYGYAMIPAGTKGVTVHGDWDALGMRASGSHSVTFENVELPASALRGGFELGDAEGYMARNLNAGLFHAAASLGIAEAAFEQALRGDARLIAESAIDLSAMRGVLSRAAQLVERRDHPVAELFAETQAAKTFTNDAACRVVDRALALSGGAGYMNGHPLSRAYRDVRAGAFMHPLGANRAYELVGSVALGAAPAIH